MYTIVHEFPHDLFKVREGPCVSLFMPTYTKAPDYKQNQIVFKNLVRDMEKSLLQKYPRRSHQYIIDTFKDMADDLELWSNISEGLAVFYARGETIVYCLSKPVKELIVVADSLHIKPLIENFQYADCYHALGINREEFTLFNGTRYCVNEVRLGKDIPNNIIDELGEDYSSAYISGRYGGANSEGTYHGHGDKSKLIAQDTEKFFRFVDKAVYDHYSKLTKFPLVLIALPEYQNVFREVSDNPYLLDEGINTNYDIFTVDKLNEEIWKVVEPIYKKKEEELLERFENSRSNDLASADLADIAKSSISNRIETLIVEQDRIIPGRVNKINGDIEEGMLDHPEFGDLLNDIVLLTIQNGGRIIVLPKEAMPEDTGLAAIYRY